MEFNLLDNTSKTHELHIEKLHNKNVLSVQKLYNINQLAWLAKKTFLPAVNVSHIP